MKNFDLKKYLAENKLLKEQSKLHPLTNTLKIHFQNSYEKGLEAQPEDDYDSFDRKYWNANQNNKEIDIIIRRYLQDSDDDLRDSYSQYGSFKEELDEENQSNPMIKTIADELLKIVQRDEDEGGAKSGISIDFPLFYELTTGILKKYL